ncbi:MAG: FHA domain-containing protein [Verrucomicrobiae bacterium]|nr:FHA domain-containing protein [Verrucomicrobiae bacterium]
MAKLIGISTDVKDFFLDLSFARVSFGRQSDNTVVLTDGLVSGHHAIIEPLPEGDHRLKDLGTTNGTFVNGIKVGEKRLTVGDTIQIGQVRFCYVASGKKDGAPMGKLVALSDTGCASIPCEVSEQLEEVKRNRRFGKPAFLITISCLGLVIVVLLLVAIIKVLSCDSGRLFDNSPTLYCEEVRSG